jgi:predicted RNA methylase
MLDRYYTPAKFASFMLAPLRELTVTMCCDTSCGTGALLMAAESQYAGIRCIGIDSDVQAIRRLRRTKPAWVLSCGDVLASNSVVRCRAVNYAQNCDLLLLNPPFSENGKRAHIHTTTEGYAIRCSIAMKHVLASLELVQPRTGVAAIMPETSWFSTLDADARGLLGRVLEIVDIKELPNSVFSGARARSLAICGVVREGYTRPSLSRADQSPRDVGKPKFDFGARIVRGGLPVFEATKSRNGIPYVHTTDLENLFGGSVHRLPHVAEFRRGVVRGWCVLLPRVGVPSQSALRPVFFREWVQLSDCVISLCFDRNRPEAERFVEVLISNYDDLCQIYRGTGARYTTLDRLRLWLAGNC